MDLLKPNDLTKILLSGISMNGMQQIVNVPTRITQKSKTLIDYVITNNVDKVKVVCENKIGIGDHEMLKIDFGKND